MHDTEILAGMTEIFRDVLDEPALCLAEAMTPADIPAWDSLRMVLLLAALEERFKIRFTTLETDRIHCVGDILEILRRNLLADHQLAEKTFDGKHNVPIEEVRVPPAS